VIKKIATKFTNNTYNLNNTDNQPKLNRQRWAKRK